VRWQTKIVERHPYLQSSGPIGFAHRGGHDVAPENTMASFEHAVSLGYRYLETDVHLTRDGVLVSFHDPDLTRTCGINAKIAEMTAAEVAAARVSGDHRIPLMEELLECFPTAHFNIDAKSDESVEPLAELIQTFRALDRVCLASLKSTRIQRMRSLLGRELLTNMGSHEVAALRFVGRVPGRLHRAAQVPVKAGPLIVVNERFVRSAQSQGIAVHVWTINDRLEMERLLDLGVDGIMTDETETLRSVLADRGAWTDP
jgi:glycerophosphoryl diester phosphodiesterase